jgi:hypothetical protein
MSFGTNELTPYMKGLLSMCPRKKVKRGECGCCEALPDDYFEQAAKKAAERAQRDTPEVENRKLRELLFLQHGNAEHYLYGDDGERHCNTCGIDFKNDTVAEIEHKIYVFNMRKLGFNLFG